MEQIKYAQNGFAIDEYDDRKRLNAHISYKGRSIIVDYEYCLHDYGDKTNDSVPFEMYPYNGNDIFMGVVSLDEKFKKADIAKLIELIDDAIEKENNANDDEMIL